MEKLWVGSAGIGDEGLVRWRIPLGYFEMRRKESKNSGAWSKGLPMG